MIFISKTPSKRMSLLDYLINIVDTYLSINFNGKNITPSPVILTTDKSCPSSFHYIFIRDTF